MPPSLPLRNPFRLSRPFSTANPLYSPPSPVLPLGADSHNLTAWRSRPSTPGQTYAEFLEQAATRDAETGRAGRVIEMGEGEKDEEGVGNENNEKRKEWRTLGRGMLRKRGLWAWVVGTQVLIGSTVVAGVLMIEDIVSVRRARRLASANAGPLAGINAAYIIWFILSLGFTLTSLGLTTLSYLRRRSRQELEIRNKELEIEKWKLLVQEKTKEVERVGVQAERLRGSLRSVSRDRKSGGGRSVSRGRRGKTGGSKESAKEKDAGASGTTVGGVQGTTEMTTVQGTTDIGLTPETAVLDTSLQERKQETNMPEKEEERKVELPVMSNSLPRRGGNNDTSTEPMEPSSTLSPLSITNPINALSPIDSSTLVTSSSPNSDGNLQGPNVGVPLVSSAYRPTALDRYVVAEGQRRQPENRMDSGPEKQNWIDSRSDSDVLVDNFPITGIANDSERTDPAAGSSIGDALGSQDFEDAAYVRREQHGEMGSLQSDDNFLAAHELEEDAVSIDSRERERRRGRSRERVMPWLEEYQKGYVNEEDRIEEIGNGSKDEITASKEWPPTVWRGPEERTGKETADDGKGQVEVNAEKELPPLPAEHQRSLLKIFKPRGRE
ncbi:MAG: hypothetical protein Q9187_007337 [Circinaria calcarea]